MQLFERWVGEKNRQQALLKVGAMYFAAWKITLKNAALLR